MKAGKVSHTGASASAAAATGRAPVAVAPVTPKAGLLLLHGRHMAATALEPFVHALSLPVRCLAPAGPVVHEDGTRSWWPVDMRQREAEIAAGPIDLFERHPAGRQAARDALAAAIGALRSQQPAGEPLIVAGFSQGAMLALDYLLQTGDERVEGLVLLSSSRLAIDEWAGRLERLDGVPVLQAHGRRDAHLSFAAGEALRDCLMAAGARVEWLPFEGGHELPLAVWKGLRRFVANLPA